MTQIPKQLHTLFWDVNIASFDPLEHPRYTISRVLELGDKEAITWMKEHFTESLIEETLKVETRLSPKSANFWAIIFGVPFNEVAALKH
ncbi:MAG: hypothetical protein M1495_23615 [Bacteroidetes bacterium]|nr:hypothetical protein [Bacteroidota bacterium]